MNPLDRPLSKLGQQTDTAIRVGGQSANLAAVFADASMALPNILAGKMLLEQSVRHLKSDRAHFGAVQDMLYQVMRFLGMAQYAKKQLLLKPLKDQPMDALLLIALAEIFSSHPRYTSHTLVHQAVEACAVLAEKSGKKYVETMKRLVNGILRSSLRQKVTLLEKAQLDEEATWNFPVWWIAQLKNSAPNDWQDVLQVAQQPAPLILRINSNKISQNKYLDLLLQAGVKAKAMGLPQNTLLGKANRESQAIYLPDGGTIESLPGYEAGWFAVQDAGAQLAALAVDLKAGQKVLDACAAPGGKSIHLFHQFPLIDLTCCDISEQRLRRVHDNLARENVLARVVCGDATTPNVWWDGHLFDHIVLDAPCSASGIVRRHPEIRWLRTPLELERLVKIQQTLMQSLWGLLAQGGTMLFVTCSIFRIECEDQAQWFVQNHPDAKRLPCYGQIFPKNQVSDYVNDLPVIHDGFFYALFQKS